MWRRRVGVAIGRAVLGHLGRAARRVLRWVRVDPLWPVVMAVRELPALAQATAEWPTAVVPSGTPHHAGMLRTWPTLWTIVRPSGKNARTTAPAKEGVPDGISGV